MGRRSSGQGVTRRQGLQKSLGVSCGREQICRPLGCVLCSPRIKESKAQSQESVPHVRYQSGSTECP